MSGLIEFAAAIMVTSEKRLAITAGNVSNMSVAGFKRQTFSQVFASDDLNGSSPKSLVRNDFEQGRLIATGNTFDFAIAGPGFFKLRMGDQIVLSRQGQFQRTAEGTLVNQQGHVLQQAGGGDIVLDGTAVEALADGTLLEGGRPNGRIAVVEPEALNRLRPLGGAIFAAEEAEFAEGRAGQVRQGMIEASNVDLAGEMTATMQAMRQAETGARLATTYDELLGRAITSLGQGGA